MINLIKPWILNLQSLIDGCSSDIKWDYSTDIDIGNTKGFLSPSFGWTWPIFFKKLLSRAKIIIDSLWFSVNFSDTSETQCFFANPTGYVWARRGVSMATNYPSNLKHKYFEAIPEWYTGLPKVVYSHSFVHRLFLCNSQIFFWYWKRKMLYLSLERCSL